MLLNIFKVWIKHPFIYLIALIAWSSTTHAQDVLATVEIAQTRISGVDNSVFKDLEAKMTEFINNRKWTEEDFESHERIKCDFTLLINNKVAENVYTGVLTVQAERPVYNSNYSTRTFAIQDSEILFHFDNSTILQFSDFNVAGSEPLAANLPAILAYYVYMIIGFDYDSFELQGGQSYFKKAENIVLNAPKSAQIKGWEADRTNARNREALVNQILNPRYSSFRPFWYEYHRTGLDLLITNPEEANMNIFSGIEMLRNLYRNNTGSYLLQWYFTTKSDEWVNLLGQAPEDKKKQFVQEFIQMDVTNANKYRRIR